MKKRAFAAMGLLAVALFGCRSDIGQGGGARPPVYELGFTILNETEGPLLVTTQVGVIPHRNARLNELEPAYSVFYTGEPVNLAEGRNLTIKAGKTGSVLYSNKFSIFQHLFDYETRTFSDTMISFVITISRDGETLYRAVGWDVPEEYVKAHRIDEKMLGFFDPAMQQEGWPDGWLPKDSPDLPWDGTIIFHLTSAAFPGSHEEEATKPIGRAHSSWTYYIRAAATGIALETMAPRYHGPVWPPEDDEFAVIERKWKWWKWWK